METIVSLLIAAGRLAGHLRGAWRCTCEIACIVNATAGVQDVVDDPGF
jgi:hypothetical protein